MRLRCAACVTLIALAACGSSTAATGGSSSGSGSPAPAPTQCGPQSARTLASDHFARVYATGGKVYGCAFRSGQSYWLGASTKTLGEGRVGVVALAASDAAFGRTTFGVDTGSTEVIVRDLADGKRLHELAASNADLAESFTSVDSIVVRADGAVAWISETSSVIGGGSSALQVWRDDSRGSALLDSASSIMSKSLHRNGSTISWRDGSTTEHSTLY